MFGFFDRMFDFDRDGKLNAFEKAAELSFMDSLLRQDSAGDGYSSMSLEPDIFGDAGLDYDDLEMMDPAERRDALEDAGLDPDDFDF